MYYESEIQLTICVPPKKEKISYCNTLLDNLRCLMDVIQISTTVVNEEWIIWPLVNPVSAMRVYTYTNSHHDDWSRDKLSMCIDCACVEIKNEYLTKQNKQRFIRAFARIHDLRPITDFSELEIRITIPRSLWREIDQDAFINSIQKTCCTLGAIYAAIDKEQLCPNSVTNSPFIYFSSDSDDNHRFTRYIPAVCWGQFLPISAINDYERMASCGIPYCKLEEIHYGSHSYVWIQFSCDIWELSVNNRIAFRKHFFSSFPELDFRKLAKYSSMLYYQKLIQQMPLFEIQRQKIKLIQAY